MSQSNDELPLRKRLLLKVFEEDAPRYLQADTNLLHIQIPNKGATSISAPSSAKSPSKSITKCATTSSPEAKKKNFLSRLDEFDDDLVGEFWTRPLPSCCEPSSKGSSCDSQTIAPISKKLAVGKSASRTTVDKEQGKQSRREKGSNDLKELDEKLDKILQEKVSLLSSTSSSETEKKLWDRVLKKFNKGMKQADIQAEQKEIEAFFKREAGELGVQSTTEDDDVDADWSPLSGSSSPENEHDLQDLEIKGTLSPGGHSCCGVHDFQAFLVELKQARLEMGKNRQNSPAKITETPNTKHAEIIQLMNLKKQIINSSQYSSSSSSPTV